MNGCGSIRRCIQRELRPAATSVSLGASSTAGSTSGSGASSSGTIVVSDEISTTSITTDDIFATTATVGRIKGYISTGTIQFNNQNHSGIFNVDNLSLYSSGGSSYIKTTDAIGDFYVQSSLTAGTLYGQGAVVDLNASVSDINITANLGAIVMNSDKSLLAYAQQKLEVIVQKNMTIAARGGNIDMTTAKNMNLTSEAGEMRLEGNLTIAQADFASFTNPMAFMNTDLKSGTLNTDIGFVFKRGDKNNMCIVFDQSENEFAIFSSDSSPTDGNLIPEQYQNIRCKNVRFEDL